MGNRIFRIPPNKINLNTCVVYCKSCCSVLKIMLNIILCKYLHAPFQNHPPLTDSKLPHQINSKTSEMLRSLVANSIGCYTGYTVVLDAQAASLYDGCILMYPWCTCVFFCGGLVDVYSMQKMTKCVGMAQLFLGASTIP